MNYKVILVTAGFVLLILAFILWQYIFNIYEVSVKSNKKQVYADQNSIVKVSAFPLNAWGFRTPLRKISADFEIIEGTELVEVLSKDQQKIKFKSKENPGKIVIKVESEYSLNPTLVEIDILAKR